MMNVRLFAFEFLKDIWVVGGGLFGVNCFTVDKFD